MQLKLSLGKISGNKLKNKVLNFKREIYISENNKKDFNNKMNQIEFMINGGLRKFQP